MARYLLTCGCGNALPVDVGQAGGRIRCTSCGAELEVPTLRKLRHLPLEPVERATERSAWGARQGVVAGFAILALAAAGIALWSRFTEPRVPQFDPAGRTLAVEEGLENLTPQGAWQLWIEVYRPMAHQGFAVFEHPHKAAIEQDIADRRFFQTMMWTVAAVAALIAVAVALWRRARPAIRN